MTHSIDRRQFLRQTFAFSALASGVAGKALAFAPDPRAHHVLMVGDWGREGDVTPQAQVAAGMVKYAGQHQLKAEALFMLGDSWYGSLPGGAHDPRWTSQFEQMYPQTAFDCPAYSVMGNHDYQKMPTSKVEAELAYAKKGGTRWTQPALWYSFDFPVRNPVMTVIALDSNVPGGHTQDTVNFTLTPAQYAEQLVWLKAELQKPRRTSFLVVIAHHPIFSNGPHGDHAILIKDWEPLFVEHKVDLYLAGHDHDLQHLEFAQHPTSFVSSGAGGADLYNLKIEESARGPYAAKVYGFSHLEVSPTDFTLRHVDADGRIVHSFQKGKDGVVRILG